MNKTMVRDIVRNNLFRAFKFVKEEDLDYGGTISKYILNKLGRMGVTGNKEFWAKHKSAVRKAIDSKRSTTAMGIKKEVLGEYKRCSV